MKDRHVWMFVCAALAVAISLDDEVRPTEIQRTVEVCSSAPPAAEVHIWWASNPTLRQVIDADRARQDGAFWCVLTDVGTSLFPGDGNLYVSGFQGDVTAWSVDETGSVVSKPVSFELALGSLPSREFLLRQNGVSKLLGIVAH
jgi:hypothetical protein